jgi:hypothetical protein
MARSTILNLLHIFLYQHFAIKIQKVPQAVVPLLSNFAYTTRDLYMSFSDDKGNNFSILFDTADAMTKLIRVIMATVAHVAGLTGAKNEEAIKGSLPPATAPSSEDVALAHGMLAGIYLSVWELGEYDDFPSDLINPAVGIKNSICSPLVTYLSYLFKSQISFTFNPSTSRCCQSQVRKL